MTHPFKIAAQVFAAAIIVVAIAAAIPAEAGAMNPVSANGFSCSSTPAPDSRALIECNGQFPGVQGMFGATGYDIVHVEYTPDNRKRYFYMSETGCLIMNALDGNSLAVDRSGSKKQFGAFTDAMAWCYEGVK